AIDSKRQTLHTPTPRERNALKRHRSEYRGDLPRRVRPQTKRGEHETEFCWPHGSAHVEQESLGGLQEADYFLRERRADVAVDDAVVEGQAEKHHVSRDDLIAPDDGAALDLMNAEDRDLGIVHDGGGEEPPVLTE